MWNRTSNLPICSTAPYTVLLRFSTKCKQICISKVPAISFGCNKKVSMGKIVLHYLVWQWQLSTTEASSMKCVKKWNHKHKYENMSVKQWPWMWWHISRKSYPTTLSVLILHLWQVVHTSASRQICHHQTVINAHHIHKKMLIGKTLNLCFVLFSIPDGVVTPLKLSKVYTDWRP